MTNPMYFTFLGDRESVKGILTELLTQVEAGEEAGSVSVEDNNIGAPPVTVSFEVDDEEAALVVDHA